MPKIMICCRTSDAFGISGRIYDCLRKAFGRGAIFLDDLDQPGASSDPRRLREATDRAREADIFLVSVGRNWLNGIGEETDPVRSVLRVALETGAIVMPVLVNGATMPTSDQLPQDIRNFAYRNATMVDPGPDFDCHIERLIHAVENVVGPAAGAAAAVPASPQPVAPSQINERSSGLIFISHSTRDRKVAETLVQALEARGLSCWISSRDVAGGENYQAAIVRAIRKARAMLLVFTENANNSEEIKKEISLASKHNVVVIPVRIEDVLPNDALEFELATRQWIDFFGDWERSVDALCKRVSSKMAG
jgi:hypothetical protein